jgi:hypothetical protein
MKLRWLIAAVLVLYRGLRPNGGVRQVSERSANSFAHSGSGVGTPACAASEILVMCGIHADDLVYRHAACNCGEQRGVRSCRADVGGTVRKRRLA